MSRSDPPSGPLALAPSDDPIRDPGERPAGGGPARRPPAPPRARYGRRRLLVVAIVVTIVAVVYFVVSSSGGGGGGSNDDAYLRANHEIATDAQSIVQAGTDLRTLRDIGDFRSSVEASVASIGAQVTALNRIAADHTGRARTIVRQTITSGEQLAQLGTTFERDVTKGELGPANRDEAAIHAGIVDLQQQAGAWNKLSA
jgi:hypothetical protein